MAIAPLVIRVIRIDLVRGKKFSLLPRQRIVPSFGNKKPFSSEIAEGFSLNTRASGYLYSDSIKANRSTGSVPLAESVNKKA